MEHPAGSYAWEAFDLERPSVGAWTRGFGRSEWVTEVCQRNYGHRAIKATWLLACVEKPPALDWSAPDASTIWISTDRPRAELKAMGVELMGHKERLATPLPFRDLLLSIARGAQSREAA